MKYVLYNIRNLAKNEKFIFAVMLLCIFISAWIMSFSYGLYQNYFSLRIETDTAGKEVRPEITGDEAPTYAEIKTYLGSLSKELLDDIAMIACDSSYKFELTNEETSSYGRDAWQKVASRSVMRDGEFSVCSYINELWDEKNMILSGRYFSDAEEQSGAYSVMVDSNSMFKPKERNLLENVILDDNTVLIYGKKYNVIGVVKASQAFFVPFLSVPGETPVDYFSIIFTNTVTRRNYNELIERADEVIPGKLNFPELDVPDTESIYIYNNIMMLSVLIAILVIFNFAFLYNFIFGKRRRQLAVMRICGCTAARAWAICLGECVVICVPVFLAGMFTYIPFMHGVLAGVFPYMEESYKPWIYAAIFGIYIIALVVIMGIFLAGQIGNTLAESRKEGT